MGQSPSLSAARICHGREGTDPLRARALKARGPKPKRAEVRTIPKSFVEWCNAKAAEFGDVIETEEREDICAALEVLAMSSGQEGPGKRGASRMRTEAKGLA